MKSVRFLSRHKILGLSASSDSIESWLSVNPFVPPTDFQLSSGGWEPNAHGTFTTSAGRCLIASLQRADRCVPAQLVTATLQEKVSQLKQRNITLGKAELNTLRAEVKQNLAFTIPPLNMSITVIFNLALEEVWLLAPSQSAADLFIKLLINLLKDTPLTLAPARLPDHIDAMKSLFNNADLGEDLAFGRNYTTTGGEAGKRKLTFSPEEPLSLELRQSVCVTYDKILAIQVRYGEHMTFTVHDDGTIKGIEVEEELLNEWFRDGDQVEHDAVNSTGVNLWAEALVAAIQKLEVAMGAGGDEQATANVADVALAS